VLDGVGDDLVEVDPLELLADADLPRLPLDRAGDEPLLVADDGELLGLVPRRRGRRRAGPRGSPVAADGAAVVGQLGRACAARAVLRRPHLRTGHRAGHRGGEGEREADERAAGRRLRPLRRLVGVDVPRRPCSTSSVPMPRSSVRSLAAPRASPLPRTESSSSETTARAQSTTPWKTPSLPSRHIVLAPVTRPPTKKAMSAARAGQQGALRAARCGRRRH
jgi:hypothetical protein